MTITDERDRLPKWAQHRIEVLETDLARLKAQRSAGPEGSDTFRYNGYNRETTEYDLTPLGKGAVIHFDGRFAVSLDKHGDLKISGIGGETLGIFPDVSNVVRIRTFQ